MNLVIKVGSSSVTNADFAFNDAVLESLTDQIARAHEAGHRIAVVSSGAIALGLGLLGLRQERPSDLVVLQAASAVGQGDLIATYRQRLCRWGILTGQILLSASDFMERRQYLSAKATLAQMMDMGIVPIINENDAVADDEIRVGDNDRIAALVAGLVGADALLLLTDQEGLFDADPRFFDDATLIEQVEEVTRELAALAGGTGTSRGSGGMATKIMAARIAAWSGVETLIAAATRPDAVQSVLEHRLGVGTWVAKSRRRLPARKLWIGFGLPAAGWVKIDDGASDALRRQGSSLLVVGVREVGGVFSADEAIEVRDLAGTNVAKGLARLSSGEIEDHLARPSGAGPTDAPSLLIHRDDMIVLEA